MRVVLDEGAFEPVRAHMSDAGLDLRTPFDFVLKAGSSATVDTGCHFGLPQGYYGKIEGKSGLNVKHGIVTLGGVIDQAYIGSVVVKLYNFGDDYEFKAGDKIAQLIIQPCVMPHIEYVDSLEETERSDRGFGSSGR